MTDKTTSDGALAAQQVPADLYERIAAAHDASLDDDHRSCRMTLCALLSEIANGVRAAAPQAPAVPDEESYSLQDLRNYVKGDEELEGWLGRVVPGFGEAAPAQPAPHAPLQLSAEEADFMRLELKRSCREVFDAEGLETTQVVREVIEYADSWLAVFLQKRLDRAAGVKEPT